MPCPSQGLPSQPRVEITDLLELHPFTAGVKYEPWNKAELVAAVVASAQGPQSLRALGTNYSLSIAAVADDVVDTSSLQMHVSQPFPASTAPLDQRRLRDGGSDFLAKVCAGDGRVAGRHFVHVEAGIKIHDLLADLKGCGLALPTMGAGGGQSLAGALSTGSHGGDFKVPPLVEWIRAVHLIGAGGQEWWITPEASIFADERVLTLPDWCDDARIVANDNAFNAVCVGVGRMGVIYSIILEVVPAYGLIEVNLEHRWSEIRAQLSTSRITAGNVSGIFDTPLSDLDSGWFRSQVLDRSEKYYPYGFRYIGGPGYKPPSSVSDQEDFLKMARHVEPPYSAWDQQHYLEMLDLHGLTGLAADLRGGVAMPLHHINIVVNLARPDQCWITRRWRREGFVRSVQLGPGERDPIVQAVIDNKRNPAGIVSALRSKLEPDSLCGELLLELGLLFDAAEAERFDGFMYVDIPRIASESTTSSEALFLILYKLAIDPVLTSDSKPKVIDAVSKAIGGAFSKLVRAGSASGGLNANVLDTHDYDLDGAQSGNSVEFFFDASSGEYLGFIDAVIALANAHSPVFGYMGIRFTPSASALIAMQRFPLTVSIEVATARARQEDVYAKFWDELHDVANQRGGIPHWGQEFRQSAAEIAAHYGENLVTWRRMLAELSIDSPNTFSTPFSRDSGLEPTEATGIFDSDATELFLVALEGACD